MFTPSAARLAQSVLAPSEEVAPSARMVKRMSGGMATSGDDDDDDDGDAESEAESEQEGKPKSEA